MYFTWNLEGFYRASHVENHLVQFICELIYFLQYHKDERLWNNHKLCHAICPENSNGGRIEINWTESNCTITIIKTYKFTFFNYLTKCFLLNLVAPFLRELHISNPLIYVVEFLHMMRAQCAMQLYKGRLMKSRVSVKGLCM
jgi:hypothetical protein